MHSILAYNILLAWLCLMTFNKALKTSNKNEDNWKNSMMNLTENKRDAKNAETKRDAKNAETKREANAAKIAKSGRFNIFSPLIVCKLHFTKQEYCLWNTYLFLICMNIIKNTDKMITRIQSRKSNVVK